MSTEADALNEVGLDRNLHVKSVRSGCDQRLSCKVVEDMQRLHTRRPVIKDIDLQKCQASG